MYSIYPTYFPVYAIDSNLYAINFNMKMLMEIYLVLICSARQIAEWFIRHYALLAAYASAMLN